MSNRTGSRWSPVQTLPAAPLWCDLVLTVFFPNSRGNKAAAPPSKASGLSHVARVKKHTAMRESHAFSRAIRIAHQAGGPAGRGAHVAQPGPLPAARRGPGKQVKKVRHESYTSGHCIVTAAPPSERPGLGGGPAAGGPLSQADGPASHTPRACQGWHWQAAALDSELYCGTVTGQACDSAMAGVRV